MTPPSPPCNVGLPFELHIENNKHPNFEWKGQGKEGCGFFCSLKLSYLSTRSHDLDRASGIMHFFPANYALFFGELCAKNPELRAKNACLVIIQGGCSTCPPNNTINKHALSLEVSVSNFHKSLQDILHYQAI